MTLYDTIYDTDYHHGTEDIWRGGYVKTIFFGSSIPQAYGYAGDNHNPLWQADNNRLAVFNMQAQRNWNGR